MMSTLTPRPIPCETAPVIGAIICADIRVADARAGAGVWAPPQTRIRKCRRRLRWRKRPSASTSPSPGCAPSCAPRATATQNPCRTKARSASCRSCRATYDELRVKYGLGPDPFDPRDNILAGAAYLAEMFARYGSTGFLAAYNAGPRRYEDISAADHCRLRPPITSLAWRRNSASPASRALPIAAPPDALRAPIFFAVVAQRAPRRMIPQGDAGHSWQEQKVSASSSLPGAFRRQTFCRRSAFDRRLAML